MTDKLKAKVQAIRYTIDGSIMTCIVDMDTWLVPYGENTVCIMPEISQSLHIFDELRTDSKNRKFKLKQEIVDKIEAL
jgi:hypothetical protein